MSHGENQPTCDISVENNPFYDYVTHPHGAAKIFQELTGSEKANIFYDHLLVKEPGTNAETPWHNDTSYWHVEGKDICIFLGC